MTVASKAPERAAVPRPAADRPRERPPPPLAGAGLVAGALFGTPLAYLLVRTASDLAAVLGAWAQAGTLGPLRRSVLLAVCVSTSAAVLGTALAWVVSRTDVPVRRTWQVLLPLPLVLPSFIAAFALLAALAPGGLLERVLGPAGGQLPSVQGFWGAFVVLTLITYPYVYLPVAARLRQLPASLEESARLLGRRPLHVFTRVVLPQTRSAVWAGTLLVFLYTVSDFGAVQLLRYDTLTRAIYSGRVYDRRGSLSLALLLALLAVAVVVIERVGVRRLPADQAASGVHHLRVRLGGWKAAATALPAAVVTTALGLPVVTLLYWASRGLGDARLGGQLAGLAAPAARTAGVSVAAAVAAVAAVLPVAYLTVRHRGRSAGVANALVVAGFALPGLVIALALVFWTVRAPGLLGGLYQTLPLLVFAYVVHFGAQALRAAQVAVAGVPPRIDDAARTLGARRMRRLYAIELPLMLPSLLAGGGLVLLSAMKELPATLILAPLGFRTLATTIWSATEAALWAEASVAALALVLLSGALTWILVIRRADALG